MKISLLLLVTLSLHLLFPERILCPYRLELDQDLFRQLPYHYLYHLHGWQDVCLQLYLFVYSFTITADADNCPKVIF